MKIWEYCIGVSVGWKADSK